MPRLPFQILVFPFRKNKSGDFEFALFRRRDDKYWQGIAGGGENNETPLDTARRESFEEAQIPLCSRFYQLSSICSIPVSNFPAQNEWPRDLYVIPEYPFGVELKEQNINISDEHLEFKWANFRQAEELLKWDSNKTALWELNQRLIQNDLK